MICLHCKHFNLQDHANHAACGLGVCKKQRGLTEFISIRREIGDCKKFMPADPGVIMERDRWASVKFPTPESKAAQSALANSALAGAKQQLKRVATP